MDWPLGVLVTAPNGWHHLADWGHCPRACCRHPESTTKPPAFIPPIHWSKSQKWGYNIYEGFLLWHKCFYILFLLIKNMLLFLGNKVISWGSLLSSGIHDWVLVFHQSMETGNDSRDTGSQCMTITKIGLYLSHVKEVPISWKTQGNLDFTKKTDFWSQDYAVFALNFCCLCLSTDSMTVSAAVKSKSSQLPVCH